IPGDRAEEHDERGQRDRDRPEDEPKSRGASGADEECHEQGQAPDDDGCGRDAEEAPERACAEGGQKECEGEARRKSVDAVSHEPHEADHDRPERDGGDTDAEEVGAYSGPRGLRRAVGRVESSAAEHIVGLVGSPRAGEFSGVVTRELPIEPDVAVSHTHDRYAPSYSAASFMLFRFAVSTITVMSEPSAGTIHTQGSAPDPSPPQCVKSWEVAGI